MMGSKLSLLLLIALIVCNSRQSQAQTSLISQVCTKTEDSAFCNSFLKENLKLDKTLRPPNVNDLMNATAGQASNKAMEAMFYTSQILRNAMINLTEREELQTCAEAYLMASDAFKDADEFFRRGEHKKMMEAELKAAKSLEMCKIKLVDVSPNDANLMTKKMLQIRVLSTMALVLGRMLPPS